MTFEPALVAYLKTAVPVLGDRIGPPPLDESPEYPALTYQRLSPSGVGVDYSHSGESRLVYPRFQLDSWSDDVGLARDTAALVAAALGGYRGTMTDPQTGDQYDVGASFLNSPGMDFYEPDTQRYRVLLEFEIWFTKVT